MRPVRVNSRPFISQKTRSLFRVHDNEALAKHVKVHNIPVYLTPRSIRELRGFQIDTKSVSDDWKPFRSWGVGDGSVPLASYEPKKNERSAGACHAEGEVIGHGPRHQTSIV